MKQRLSLVLSLLAVVLTISTSLTSCNTETEFSKQNRKRQEEQQKKDDLTIQAYLKRNNITNYTRYNSGIHLVNVVEGPTTNPLITAGKKVTTNYVGKYIDEYNDGQVFRASSANRTPCGCISYYAGQSSEDAPTGVQEAILQMRQGDRKLAIIPSTLLLIPRANGTSTFLLEPTPAQPLLYDIEVLTVE